MMLTRFRRPTAQLATLIQKPRTQRVVGERAFSAAIKDTAISQTIIDDHRELEVAYKKIKHARNEDEKVRWRTNSHESLPVTSSVRS